MKPVLDYVEFHITNVCNFNCSGCSRYTNYYFSGQQKWDDYSDIYTKWKELIDIDDITILGGEPLLNPDIIKWIDGIASIWNDTKIRIVTNGTHINKVNKLYDTIKKYNGRVYLEVGVHNIARHKEVLNECTDFLDLLTYNDYSDRYSEWKDSYNSVRDSTWPDCDTPAEFSKLPEAIQTECINIHNFGPLLHTGISTLMVDINNVEIDIRGEYTFDNIGLKYQEDNTFTLCDSDREKAHSVCVQSQCHQFFNGKLHKCPTVALLPEFIKQFHVVVGDNDTMLINNYNSLSVHNTKDEIATYISSIKDSVPQCKFCPEVTEGNITTNASTNKIRVKKK